MLTKRIVLTLLITTIYCYVWMGLELLLYGRIENRTVDNIVMLLFVPVIYLATTRIIRR